MRVCKIRLSLLVLLLLLNIQANAQLLYRSISVVGTNWTPIIPTINEAGTDYVGNYESPVGQIKLNVAVPLLLSSGKISVRYEPNPLWNSALKIHVSKLDDGLGLCVLCLLDPFGATPFKEVLQTDSDLFKIYAVANLASVNNINLSIKLSGVSVVVPVENYSARLVFTIGPI